MRRLIPLFVLLVAAACHSERENVNAFNWSRELAPGGTLRVRNTNGTVIVVPSTNGRTARVQAATHWRRGNPERDLKFVALSEGNDATICVHWGTGTCTATEYTNRRARGFLSLFSGRGTDARVDFTVEVPPGTRVDVSTMNGELTVTTQSPVVARTVNGGIHVATAIGPVSAKTVNGAVDVRMTTIDGAGDVRAETTNGDVSLYVPSTAEGQVTLSTTNGTPTSWFPLGSLSASKKRFEGQLGTGTRVIVGHTVNGSVTFGALDAQGRVMSQPAP
jgi:hypothetical protein